MIKKYIIHLLLFLGAFLIISCGTSTGSRYSKTDDKSDQKESEPADVKIIEDDFDLTPYHAEIEIKETKKGHSPEDLDVWYNYSETDSTSEINISAEKVDGYRVQVYSTDNLEEANDIRSEVYFRANLKNVYVLFDPPFYKVKAGDFTSISEANDLNFKLNQLGFSETRVVKDSVNIYR